MLKKGNVYDNLQSKGLQGFKQKSSKYNFCTDDYEA